MCLSVALAGSSALHLSIAIFLWLLGSFPSVMSVFAKQSGNLNTVGIQRQATVKAGKNSLKVSQTKSSTPTTLTKKLSSQSSSQSAVLKPFRQSTATKIVPKKSQTITKTSTTVSKTASPKTVLSKSQTVVSKTTTVKGNAAAAKKSATVASSKTPVQKSPVSSKAKAQTPSKTLNSKVLLKTSSQAVSPKQTALKVTPKQSVTHPKPVIAGTSVGTYKPSLALPVKSMQPAFSLNTSVRLSDAAKQLRLKYSVSGQGITLSNGRNCFEFQSGTKEAKFNGIKIFLSFPIEKQSVPMTRIKKLVHRLGLLTEEYRIRTADVESILKPLLFPQNFVKKRAKTIVLDPGHGGKAEGTVQNGLKEKLLTLKTAQLLAGKLRSMGYIVYLTRTSDIDVSLSQRSLFANMKHADLFVSVHYNSAPSDQARGIEVFAFPLAGCPSSDHVVTKEFNSMPGNAFDGQNSLLGWQVQKEIIQNTGSVDRGVKRKRLAVLRELNCPGILVECGFLSHPTESKTCNSADYQEKLTRAIADGIRAYNGG